MELGRKVPKVLVWGKVAFKVSFNKLHSYLFDVYDGDQVENILFLLQNNF